MLMGTVVLFVGCKSSYYTVTFDPANGEKVFTVDVDSGSIVTPPEVNPTKPGFNFANWYIGETSFDFSSYVRCNLTLKAQWTAKELTATFDSQEGSTPDPESKLVVAGMPYGEFPTVTKTGYILDGWYTAIEDGTKIETTTIVSTSSDHLLYARWIVEQYEIILSQIYGVAGNTTSVTATYGALLPDLESSDLPTRENYSFSGFVLIVDVDSPEGYYDETGKGIKEWTKTEATTLYAVWIANKYSITYMDSDSTQFSGIHGANYPIEHQFDRETTLVNPRAKTGYIFKGWVPSLLGNTVVTTLPANAYTENVTLYAVWEEAPFSVSFNSNGGSGTIESQSFTFGGQSPLTSNTFDRTGYTFAGWAERSAGEVKYNDRAGYTMGAASVILYAKWNMVAPVIIGNGYNAVYDGANDAISLGMTHDLTLNYTDYQWSKFDGGNYEVIDGATNETHTVKDVADTGTYSCTVTYTDPAAGNGAVTSSGSITVSNIAVAITRVPLTVTANDISITYGALIASAQLGYVVTGILSLDAISVVNGTADYNLNTTDVYEVSETSSTGVTVSGLSTDNYTIDYTSGNFTVLQATPTIKTSPTAGGLSVGQPFSGSAFTEGKAVATVGNEVDKTVVGSFAWTAPLNLATATGNYNVTFTPTDTVNYTTATKDVNVVVTQLTITATAGANGTISPADVINVNYGAEQVYEFVPVVGYEVNQVTIDGGTPMTQTGNSYTVSNVTANKTILISFKASDNIVTFDSNGGSGAMNPQTIATNVAANLTDNGFNRSGYTFAGWAATDGGVVTHDNSGSYTMGVASVTLYAKWNIVAPVITGNGYNAVYDGANDAISLGMTHDLTLNYTDYQWSKLDGGTYEVIVGATNETLTVKDVADTGTYSCTVTYTDPAPGYGAVTFSGTITVNDIEVAITPAPLTVTANDISITYGALIPSAQLGYSATNFLVSDAISVVTGTATYNLNTTIVYDLSATNLTGVTVSGLSADNYAISYAPGGFTVLKAVPTIKTPPIATGLSVGQALSASRLTGGGAVATVNGVETAVEGAVAWTTPDTVPSVTGAYNVTFTPTDTANYNTATVNVTVEVVVTTPTISPNGDFVDSSVITLACTTEGASIYYTIDGTSPTAGSSKYPENPFTFTTDTTVKFIAIKAGCIDSDVVTVNLRKVGYIETMLVEKGTFTMGPTFYDPDHSVTLTRDFYMGKYEVTQAQWKAVMDDGSGKWPGNIPPPH